MRELFFPPGGGGVRGASGENVAHATLNLRFPILNQVLPLLSLGFPLLNSL